MKLSQSRSADRFKYDMQLFEEKKMEKKKRGKNCSDEKSIKTARW